jgi:hypothetical protein
MILSSACFGKVTEKNSLRRDRQLVVNYMCEAAGGPVFYTGRVRRLTF